MRPDLHAVEATVPPGEKMKRFAVYTVQTGEKGDFAGFGIHPSDDYDLIVFTDDPHLREDGVETRVIDTHGLDPARLSRRPKLLPHRYLPEYEWSLYIDSNARLKDDPTKLQALCGTEQSTFFAFKHPDRDCAYDEAEVVIRLDYDDERRVREQMDHYRSFGFPCEAGLIAGTVLLRQHHDPGAVSVAEEWYEHVLRFSKRDQLSFNFVAWRRGFNIGTLPGSPHENPHVLWPARPRSRRITADFDPEVYSWLNPEVADSGLTPHAHFLESRLSRGVTGRYKRHSWQLRKLANKHRSDKGDIYFNAHCYADIYEAMLSDRRNEPLRVLEMGLLRHDVQARNPGGPYDDAPSLAMWSEFLPNSKIWGFDIADFSAVPLFHNVTIVRGDMGSEEDLSRLIEAAGGGFDIIIDDGSHASHHQQIPLGFLFAHLNPGGLYFIEDLHHQPKHLEPAGAVKTLEVLRSLAGGSEVLTGYVGSEKLNEIRGSIASVSFFDSWDRTFGKIHSDAIAVLRKQPDPKIAREIPMTTTADPKKSIRKFGTYALESGWLRSELEKAPVDKEGSPLPWLCYPAIRFLSERVNSEMNVFEFGSGNSTLWWAERVKAVTSVEHDLQWSAIFRERIPQNVSYNTVELEPGGDYSRFATLSRRGPFDVVVVDGRDRVNCALNSLSELKDDGVIIFDNSERSRYRPAHEALTRNGFKRLKLIGIGPLAVTESDTSIFYRPNNCLDL